jgi:predicted dehydrogenase
MSEQTTPSRRSFVKGVGGSVALGMGAAYVPSSVKGANDKLNVAVIGVGGRGSSLLREVCGLRDSKGILEVIGVCDIYMKRVDRAVEVSGAKGYTDYKELLQVKELDAVIIATPDHWHAQMAIDACNAGKDVYLEKPMTHTTDEARELWQVVKKTGKVLQVGSQTTSQDIWWKARQVMSSKVMGKHIMSQGSYHRNSVDGEWNYNIDPEAGPNAEGDNRLIWEKWLGSAPKMDYDSDRYFRFRKYWDYSGGIATDLFYHVVAPLQICWGGGEFPYRVTGTGGRFVFTDDREVPDTFTLTADYKTGHHLALTSSMANGTHVPGLLRGHEATLMLVEHGRFEGRADYITLTPEGQFADGFRERCEDAGLEGEWIEQAVKVRGKRGDSIISVLQMPVETRQTHMENFLECVKTREKPVLDVLTGFKALATIDLAVESFKRGRTMYFDDKTYKMTETPIKDPVHG